MICNPLLYSLVVLTWCFSSCAQDKTPDRVILGDERFEEYVPALEGKKVAVFSNHSGIVGNVMNGSEYGPHLVDVLLE